MTYICFFTSWINAVFISVVCASVSQEKSSSFGKYGYTERARLFSWQRPEKEMRLPQNGPSSSISICTVHTYTNIEQLLRIAYQLFSCLLIPDEHVGQL